MTINSMQQDEIVIIHDTLKIIIYCISDLKLFFKAGELLDKIMSLKEFLKNELLVAFFGLKWTKPRRLLQWPNGRDRD